MFQELGHPDLFSTNEKCYRLSLASAYIQVYFELSKNVTCFKISYNNAEDVSIFPTADDCCKRTNVYFRFNLTLNQYLSIIFRRA